MVESKAERNRRLARQRQKKHYQLNIKGTSKQQEKSKKRRREGRLRDNRDHKKRCHDRRENGTLIERRNQQDRSLQRRKDGTHADNRDELIRSRDRREDGTHGDKRDQRERSRTKRSTRNSSQPPTNTEITLPLPTGSGEPLPIGSGASVNRPSRRVSQNDEDPIELPTPILENEILTLLHNNQFNSEMRNIVNYKICLICREIDLISNLIINNRTNICSRDARQRFKKFSKEAGMIPDEIPEVLKNLSLLEELLICRHIPFMHISRLRGGGQYGYRNHVIAFPQDVNAFAQQLPRSVSDSGIIIVRKEGLNNTHRDYRVRRNVVFNALVWLKDNNPYYSHIEICEDRLQELPDDDIPSNIPTQIIPDNQQTTHRDQAEEDEEQEDTTEITSVTRPVGTRRQVDHINSVINNQPITPWPPLHRIPTNEYTEAGLHTQIFPTVFPTGNGDITHPQIERTPENVPTPTEWAKHSIAHEDGRCPKHPRFGYYVLNKILRYQAVQTGKVFMKRNEKNRNISIEELQEQLRLGPKALEFGLVHFGAHIRGTMNWKLSKRMELYDIVDFIGLPTFFITLSAADLHWPDLHVLMQRHEAGNIPNYSEEVDDAGRNGRVNRNPHMVDAFFVRRVKTFLKHVVGDNLKNHWYIYEWQHRGSIHAHGLLWLHDAPFPKNPNAEEIVKHGTEEQKSQLIKYYSSYVSAWNPCSLSREDMADLLENHPNDPQLANPTIYPPQSTTHPCRIRSDEVTDQEQDLAGLLNKVQRHGSCNPQTCLRKKKRSDEMECKAGFPKPLRLDPGFVEDPKRKGEYVYVPERNDPILNQYPLRGWIQFWRANMDLKPVLSLYALIMYLSKYMTKDESSSTTLLDIVERLIQLAANGSDIASTDKAFAKYLMQFIGNRDMSLQECIHHLRMEPGYETSETCVVISLNEVEITTDPEQPIRKSNWEMYLQRKDNLNQSMYDYVQHHTLGPKKNTRRKKPCIPRFYPRYDEVTSPQDRKFDEYCHIKLMMYRPSSTNNPLNPDNRPWPDVIREYAATENNNLPEKVRNIITGRVEPNPDDQADESSEFEPTQEEEEELEGLPDHILAARPNQPPEEEQAYIAPPDRDEYWRSLPEDLAADAHR